jgi:acyl-CoA synthetase (AMP-forming)/AMP-acid ligase II
MGDKEKMDYLLVDIRELEKLVASMRDAEIYPVSFFSQAYTTTQKIVDNLQSIEADQLALFKEQMEKHRALIKKAERLEAEAALVTQMQEYESNYEPVQEMELPSVEELNEEEESVATPAAATVAAEKTVSEPAASLSSASSHATTLEQSLPHSISLNEVIQKKFLADFRKAFSLNDRFRFRRELFGGDEGRMNEAISDLNELQSFEESITYLDKKLKWNVEDEAVADFIKLLEKRFS